MPDFGIFRGFNEKLFGDKLVAGQLPTELGFIGSGDFGFDPDYKAVLDYANARGYALPSSYQLTLQNRLVLDLKDAGVWSKLDLFYVFATDGDSDFASINWKDPNNFECTEVNSPTFTTNEGFASNGTSSYLNTNFNLSTDGTNYSQNDAGSIFGISKFIAKSSARPYGSSGINNYLSARFDINRFWINATTTYFNLSSFSAGDNNQILFTNRPNSLDVNGRITNLETSTTNTASRAITSTPLLNENMYILRSANTVWDNGNTSSLFALGSNLSTAEMEDVETAYYTNYFTNL